MDDCYYIYQLKQDDKTRDFRFRSYDALQGAGHKVDPANYDLVYCAILEPDMGLGDIWEKFNINHPEDFRGHSLSVSDVVVLNSKAYYVDSFGYRQVQGF